MTTRQGYAAVQLPDAKPTFDVDNERQFRRAVSDQLQQLGSAKIISLPFYDVTDFGNRVGQGYDDTTAVTDAITEVNALGGGQLLFPTGTFLLSTDISLPRTIMPMGLGGDRSIIKSTSTQRRFKVTGTTTTAGDLHLISGLMFDTVSVDYGPTSSDTGRGCVLAFCDLVNSDRAVYYGYHTFNTKIIGCNFRVNARHVYYDFATVATDAGADMCISDSVLSECTSEALYMNGSTADGYHIHLTNVICDNSARFLNAVGVSTDGIVSIKNISFELISDAFIVNDGANVFVDGFYALSGTEHYWVWNKSGFVQFKNGRGAWNANKFSRTDGGIVLFDQASSFMNAPMWGQNSTPFAAASSTGGMVIGPRGAYVGRHSVPSSTSAITVTDASPTNAATRLAESYDFNDRTLEFDIVSSAIGTDNTLRVQLADGGLSPSVDLPFPVVAGGARVRVVWTRGVELKASAVFAPTTAGNAAFVSASTADTTALASTKFLDLSTIKAGATASTLTITNLVETISGHRETGL